MSDWKQTDFRVGDLVQFVDRDHENQKIRGYILELIVYQGVDMAVIQENVPNCSISSQPLAILKMIKRKLGNVS